MERNIGKRLTILMQEKGWTQEELAGILQVTHGSVSHWCAGRVNMPSATFVKLGLIFGVSLDWLAGRTNDRTTHQVPPPSLPTQDPQ